MSPFLLDVLYGGLIVIGWEAVGVLMVLWLRADLFEDTSAAMFNVLLWPLGVVMQKVFWPIYRRRRERARQARITAKVQSGEYAVEHARNLGWKG